MAFYVEPRNTGDQQICAAIEAKNWKTALKLVETKKKKKPDPHFDALEFYISCRHPNATQRTQALVSLRDAASSGDAKGASTAQTLVLYDEGLKALGMNHSGPEVHAVCKLRADAVKANRKDEDLAVECFKVCMEYKAYEFGIQIAMSLQANLKQERKYHFWLILCRWLYSLPHDVVKSSRASKSDALPMQAMHGNLARAMLNKIADQTSSRSDGKTPDGGIQTPQELLLFQTIAGAADESRLTHESLLPECNAAKGGWVFWRNHIEALQKRNDYDSLFTVCQKLLTDAIPQPGNSVADKPEGADWLVWKNFIWSATESKSLENDSKVAELIQYYLSNTKLVDKTYRRNAWLAAVEYAFQGLLSKRSESATTNVTVTGRETVKIQGVTSRVLAIATYFFRHVGAPSVFPDLRSYVSRLSEGEQSQFLSMCAQFPRFTESSGCSSCTINFDDISDTSDTDGDSSTRTGAMSSIDRITAAATYQKFAYVLRLDSGLTSESTKESLLQLALANIRLYNDIIVADEKNDNPITKSLLPTDMHPADDFLLIAASCLLQASIQRQETIPIGTVTEATLYLQAVAILEYGLTRSKANSQFNLVLVRIYTTLGAGALAMRAYQRLNLKRIQNDTLGYILYDRISSLHPRHIVEQVPGFTDGSDSMIPSKELSRIQRLYRDFDEQASKNVWLSIQHGSYDAAIQILFAGEKIKRSCYGAMIVMEQIKLARLQNVTKPSTDYGFHNLNGTAVWEDNSDYKTFPNFDYAGAKRKTLEERTRTGPAPSSERVQSLVAQEHVWDTLKSNETIDKANIKQKVEWLHSLKSPSLDDDQKKTITDEERLSLTVTRQLVSILYTNFCKLDGEDTTPPLDSYIEMITSIIEELKVKGKDENYIPGFEQTLHPLYTFHDLSHLIFLVAKFLSSPSCPSSKSNKETTQKLQNMAKSLNALTRTTANAIKESVDRSGMIDRVLGAIRAEHSHTSKAQNGQKTEADDIDHLGRYIEEMCDRKDSFLENFAGELAIAWRDSVAGFSLFRAI